MNKVKTNRVLIVVSVILFLSCDLFTPSNQQDYYNEINIDNTGVPDWYPSKVEEGDIIEAENKFYEFCQTYNQNYSHPFTNPFFPRINNSVSLNPFITIIESEDSINEIEFKEVLEEFVYEWWRLFSSQEFAIDTITFEENEDWDYKRAYIFIKEFYEYPIVDPEHIVYGSYPDIGYIRVLFDEDMNLVSLYSSLLPRMKVPLNPVLNADSAKALITGLGYWWQYGHSSNRGVYIIKKNDIKSLGLKTYMHWRGDDYLAFRLSWEIITYNVIPGYPEKRSVKIYLDALTGDILKKWDPH